MRRFFQFVLPISLGICALSGYIPPRDRKYVDYFLKLEAAELFRTKSFLLNSSWAYVGQKKLERVDMRFSYYRVMDVNQTRELLVKVVQQLVDKINSDSMLRQKNLLPEPFSVDQLHLEIRMDNIVSANADPPTIRLVILDRGVVSYQTFRISTLFYGCADVYKETFQYALMLLDKPTEFEDPYIYGKEPIPIQDVVKVEKAVDVEKEVKKVDLLESSSLDVVGKEPTYRQIYRSESVDIFQKPASEERSSVPMRVVFQEINGISSDTPVAKTNDLIQGAGEVVFSLFPEFQLSSKRQIELFEINMLENRAGETRRNSVTDTNMLNVPDALSRYGARHFAFDEDNPDVYRRLRRHGAQSVVCCRSPDGLLSKSRMQPEGYTWKESSATLAAASQRPAHHDEPLFCIKDIEPREESVQRTAQRSLIAYEKIEDQVPQDERMVKIAQSISENVRLFALKSGFQKASSVPLRMAMADDMIEDTYTDDPHTEDPEEQSVQEESVSEGTEPTGEVFGWLFEPSPDEASSVPLRMAMADDMIGDTYTDDPHTEDPEEQSLQEESVSEGTEPTGGFFGWLFGWLFEPSPDEASSVPLRMAMADDMIEDTYTDDPHTEDPEEQSLQEESVSEGTEPTGGFFGWLFGWLFEPSPDEAQPPSGEQDEQNRPKNEVHEVNELVF